MAYHALKNLWTPVEGEELTTIVGLGNIEKKFAVAVWRQKLQLAI